MEINVAVTVDFCAVEKAEETQIVGDDVITKSFRIQQQSTGHPK